MEGSTGLRNRMTVSDLSCTIWLYDDEPEEGLPGAAAAAAVDRASLGRMVVALWVLFLSS